MNPNTPYEALTPDLILDAVEQLGFRCTGNLMALNSFENRVYQIGVEEAPPFIAKFYRPGRWSDAMILEEHQFALELTEHEIPVVAPWQNNSLQTLHHYQQFRFTLFPKWGGRALEVDRLEQLEWMGRFIGRLHAVSACKPFTQRIQLNPQTYGHDAYHYLLAHQFIPEHIKSNYCYIVDQALHKIDQHFARVQPLEQIRLHGDMHAGNVLWNDAGPHIVDLDDCLTGPAIQDIWMLLSGDASQMKLQLQHILNGYYEFHDFDPRELKLIESLRTLRMLHYSAWLARRWDDPAFPLSFPWFNTATYWQAQLQHLQEQVELLEE